MNIYVTWWVPKRGKCERCAWDMKRHLRAENTSLAKTEPRVQAGLVSYRCRLRLSKVDLKRSVKGRVPLRTARLCCQYVRLCWCRPVSFATAGIDYGAFIGLTSAHTSLQNTGLQSSSLGLCFITIPRAMVRYWSRDRSRWDARYRSRWDNTVYYPSNSSGIQQCQVYEIHNIILYFHVLPICD